MGATTGCPGYLSNSRPWIARVARPGARVGFCSSDMVAFQVEATPRARAVNFMEYALPLGRRFRALKLWFVMRYFGREGLAANLREHIRLAQEFARLVEAHPEFEVVAPHPFSVVCFRYVPQGKSAEEVDRLNQELIEAVNRSGEFYLSNTVLHERFVLRVAIGNLRTTSEHVERLWELVVEKSRSLGD